MRKLSNLFFLLPLAIVLIVLSVANRQSVRFSFDPTSAETPALTVELPFFVFLFIAVLLGLIIGASITWWTQGRYRKALRKACAEADRLREESEAAKGAKAKETKEIAPGLPVVAD